MANSKVHDDYDAFSEFYEFIVPYRERKDVAFYVEMARRFGGPVLEIGCGTGRILIPTARAGIDIVGLEASHSMLEVCRKKLLQEPSIVHSRVRLICGDMRNFKLRRTFGLVTIPFRSFQHMVSVADQFSCLARIQHHLQHRGTLVLDVFNPSLPLLVEQKYLKQFGEEPAFTMPDGRKVIRSHRIISRDLPNQIQDVELTYRITRPDGVAERMAHRFRLRYFFRFELQHLLARCGFDVEELYGDFEHSPYGGNDSSDLIAVARKK